MSDIEVEARALLSPAQRESMLDYMRTLGEVQEISRVMIDFSGEDRERTVALRVNNGRQQLIAKTGSLTDTVRTEAMVPVEAQNSLEQTLNYLAVMGYSQGMLSLRHMFVVKTGELEYSVRDVLAHNTLERVSTLLDIEALNVAEGDEQAAKQRVYVAFAAHELSPLSEIEWTQWVRETYEQVDRPFENSPGSARSLASSLTNFTQA